MTQSPVARRYAQALYEEAQQHGRVEAVDQDMDLIRETLDGSRELVLFFESPILTREKKETVVQELFEGHVQPTTLHFIRLLVEKKREDLLPSVVRAYRALRDAEQGIVEAKARTAHPLSDAEQKALTQALEKLTGKRIRLQVEQDATLIGGVVVRVGDTVYDGSVRHKLASLRERLEQGSFAGNGTA